MGKNFKPVDLLTEKDITNLSCPYIIKKENRVYGKTKAWIKMTFTCQFASEIVDDCDKWCSLADFYHKCPYNRI